MSEASKTALKRGMTPTHELMVDWELQNPGGTLKEMGDFFGYNPSWLSTIMHSDAYKSYRAGRLGDVHSVVTMDIPARMKTLATLAIDRMEEVLTVTSDPDTIKDSFDKVMHRYGYAPGNQKGNPLAPGFQQNNVFFLSPEQLQKHREVLIGGHSNPQNPPLLAPATEQPVPAETDEPEKIPTG